MKTGKLRLLTGSLLATATLAAVTLVTGSASADECILGPVALPYLSGPPVWFDPGGGQPWRPELHDPRWSGTPLRRLTLHTVGSGTGEEAQVRGLIHNGKLYFSFEVASGASGAPTAGDAVYLAFREGTANGAYAIEINPVAGSGSTCMEGDTQGLPCAGTTPPAPPGGGPAPTYDTVSRVDPSSFRVFHTLDATVASPTWVQAIDDQGTPANLADDDLLPDWLQQMAVWTGAPGTDWGVTFVVDASSSGLNFSGLNHMFWGVRIDQLAPTADILVGNASPVTSGINTDTPIPVSSTSWVTVTDPGTCPGGVRLSPADVGTWDGSTLSTNICGKNAVTGPCVGSDGTNTFRVIARNLSIASPADWTIRARVRTAAWGSQVSDRKFGPWKDIPLETPTAEAIITDAPASFSTGWTFGYTNTGASSSDVTIDYHCALASAADPVCPMINSATQDTHQCMLVELGQRTVGAGAQRFQESAVYQNMNYVGLSEDKRPASISLEGLKALTGSAQDRDIYVHVEQHNMPPVGNKAMTLPLREMELARRFAENPVPIPTPEREVPGKPGSKGDAPKPPQAVAPKPPTKAVGPNGKPLVGADRYAAAARIALSTARIAGKVNVSSTLAMTGSQILDATWPTYRVRVYYDTGTTFTKKGVTRKVLAPMVPFGFRLSHEGTFFGFASLFEGIDGLAVEKLPDDWYVLRKVKSESTVRVQTTLTAVETGTETPPGSPTCPVSQPEHRHCNCRLVGPKNDGLGELGVALALGLSIALRRRSSKRKAG